MTTEVDLNRPRYIREKGEIGICLDVYSAVPEKPGEIGSEQFYLMTLMDSLFEEFSKLDLHLVKAKLVHYGTLHNVVLQKFLSGIILVTRPDNEESLETIWTDYKLGRLEKVLAEVFIYNELLEKLRTKSIVLRTRLYDDERELWHEEFKNGQILKESFETDGRSAGMVRLAKANQVDLPNRLADLQDTCTQFECHVSELFLSLRRGLGEGLMSVSSVQGVRDSLTAIASVPGTHPGVVQYYLDLLQHCLAWVDSFCQQVYGPLSQIPASCETSRQQDLKGEMYRAIRHMGEHVTPTTDVTTLKHPYWLPKCTRAEKGLLLGLVSLLSVGMDTVVDIDHLYDEYMSAIPDNIC